MEKEYKQRLPNQSINHRITWEWADFETYPLAVYLLFFFFSSTQNVACLTARLPNSPAIAIRRSGRRTMPSYLTEPELELFPRRFNFQRQVMYRTSQCSAFFSCAHFVDTYTDWLFLNYSIAAPKYAEQLTEFCFLWSNVVEIRAGAIISLMFPFLSLFRPLRSKSQKTCRVLDF